MSPRDQLCRELPAIIKSGSTRAEDKAPHCPTLAMHRFLRNPCCSAMLLCASVKKSSGTQRLWKRPGAPRLLHLSTRNSGGAGRSSCYVQNQSPLGNPVEREVSLS